MGLQLAKHSPAAVHQPLVPEAAGTQDNRPILEMGRKRPRLKTFFGLAAMRIEQAGRDCLLQLDVSEVALLVDILEAALPAEAISGPATVNPSMSRFFNEVYARLIDTARTVWKAEQPS